PAATGAAALGVAVLSGMPPAPPASSFEQGPAEAEPAPWAEPREETRAREETPAGEGIPQAEPRTVAPPAAEPPGDFSDAAPGKPVEPRGEPTAAPADAWLQAPASAPNQGAAATATTPRPATRDRTATDFFGLPPPEPTGSVAADEDEEHWKAVYQDFLRVRTDCGEPREGVAYERFREKLQKNRDQLVERYGCRTVRFQVYVKEGKAALKASPVR
ncbi:MAG TPA: MXAN_5187 C-terminal domain-containing protein, partial [Anaeromyxobacteraceae bacterium]